MFTFHDVSHHQINYQPTGLTVAKATQGTDFIDPTFIRIRSACAAHGWTCVAYHWVTNADPQAQARHALAVIGKTAPAMWDIESDGVSLPHLLAVHDAYEALGGHARLVYLPHWYWLTMGSPSLAPLTSRGLHLVSSNYPKRVDLEHGPGWAPYGGMQPLIWQYTDSPIDTNVYRGTQQQLTALLQPFTPKPPPAPLSHVVRSGETLTSIASAWHVSVTAVEAANPRAGHGPGNFSNIWPGDVIHHP